MKITCSIIGSVLVTSLVAQAAARQSPVPEPKNWTAAEDHQHMMDELGIKTLRPGPSGNEQAPNHANYDEATANPFPNLPDVLTLENGSTVTSVMSMSTLMTGYDELSTWPTTCLSTTGRVPASPRAVFVTVHATAGTCAGMRP